MGGSILTKRSVIKYFLYLCIMRPPKVEEEELLKGLMSVLRSKGYDGASLNELAGSSGLKKASLYHRFPGGKKEITTAVLQYVNEWFATNIENILLNQDLPPAKRLVKVVESINYLYEKGKQTCLLRALSMDTGITLFAEELKQSMQKWIDNFSTLGLAFGYAPDIAQQKAVQVITNIQGSLVVSKALGNAHPFEQAMDEILRLYKVSRK